MGKVKYFFMGIAVLLLMGQTPQYLYRDLDMTGHCILNIGCMDGLADCVVTTVQELYDCIDNADEGDVILIKRGLYEINRWLDIEVSGLSIIGQLGYHAETLGVMIRVEDDIGVGGFRIGHTDTIEYISIKGIGFDGNSPNQPPDSVNCHAFLFENVSNADIENCYITQPHRYRPVDVATGGVGIRVERTAKRVRILNNIFEDCCRDIAVAGKDIIIEGNLGILTWERMISLDVYKDSLGESLYVARSVIVDNNINRHSIASDKGAMIGCGGSDDIANRIDTLGNFTITNNIAYGKHRRLMTFRIQSVPLNNILISNNTGIFGLVPLNDNNGIYVDNGDSTSFLISNNMLENYYYGIDIESSVFHRGLNIEGNMIHNSDEGGIYIHHSSSINIIGNVISDVAGDGIYLGTVSMEHISITGNQVYGCTGNGIETEGTVDWYIITDNLLWDNNADIVDGAGGANTVVADNLEH